MNKKVPDKSSSEIEDWDDFEEVNLTNKRYVSDDTREKLSYTTEEVIQKFREIHGDRYDYSKVDYKGSKEKVIVICREHGEFQTRYGNHVRGRNCRKCSQQAVNDIRKRTIKKMWEEGKFDNQILTNETLIERFKKIFGDKYDYSKFEYDVKNRYKPLVIICPIHGEFTQPYRTHLKGKGCQKCAIEETRETKKQKLIKDFKDVHGDRYDYSKVVYVNTKTKIEIICSKHGSFFQQPIAHKKGQICRKCRLNELHPHLEKYQ